MQQLVSSWYSWASFFTTSPGSSECFCVMFTDYIISSDALWQRKSIWSLLHCFPQTYETGIWGEFQLCGIGHLWKARGLWDVRPCIAHPQTVALATVLPLPVWTTVRCPFVPLCLCFTFLVQPPYSCSGQRHLRVTACRSQVFTECRGNDFYTTIDNKQHHNIATNWFF